MYGTKDDMSKYRCCCLSVKYNFLLLCCRMTDYYTLNGQYARHGRWWAGMDEGGSVVNGSQIHTPLKSHSTTLEFFYFSADLHPIYMLS